MVFYFGVEVASTNSRST